MSDVTERQLMISEDPHRLTMMYRTTGRMNRGSVCCVCGDAVTGPSDTRSPAFSVKNTGLNEYSFISSYRKHVQNGVQAQSSVLSGGELHCSSAAPTSV